MSELAGTAERLRTVKHAVQEFIQLWAIDQLMEEHAICDRIAGDILCASDIKNSNLNHLSYLYQRRGLVD